MAVNIGPKIGIDGEAQFRKELNNIIQQSKTLASEMKSVTSAFDKNDNSQEKLAAQSAVLTKQIETQEQRIEQLKKGLAASAKEFGEADTRTQKWKQAVNDATSELNNMRSNLKGLDSAVDDTADSLDDASDSALSFGDALAAGGIIEGAKAIVGAVGDIVENTKEYRKIMASLEVSSKNAGYTAEETIEVYRQLFGILGDNQQSATTTANLQALNLEQEHLIELTNGVIGAWATYGDSIPIDSLAEATNETIRVGKVTGTFADVLNWAGTNEDEFNNLLETANDETERANIVLNELTHQGLTRAGKEWRENNKEMVKANEITANIDQATARLAKVAAPAVNDLREAYAELLDGIAKVAENADELRPILLSIGAAAGTIGLAVVASSAKTAFVSLLSSINPVALGLTSLVAVMTAATVAGNEYAKANATIIDTDSQMMARMDDLRASYENISEAANQRVTAELSEIANAERLYDELKSLVSANGEVSEANRERVDFILSELNTALGTEYAMTGNLIKNYQEMDTTIKDLMETKQAEILLASAEDAYAEAIRNRAEVQKNTTASYLEMVAQQNAVDETRKELTKVMADEQGSALWKLDEGYRQHVQNRINDLSIELQEEEKALAERQEAYNNSQSLLDQYYQDIAAYESAAAAAQTGNTNQVLSQLDRQNTGYRTAKDVASKSAEEQAQIMSSQYGMALTDLRLYAQKFESGTKGYTEQGIKALAKYALDAGNEAEAAGVNIDDGLRPTLEGLASGAYLWGQEMSDSLAAGIRAAIPNARAAAKELASTVAGPIHYSRPDYGPLRYSDRWMSEMIDGMVEDLRANYYKLENAVASMAGNMASGAAGVTGKTISATYNMQVYGAPGQDVNTLSEIVMRRIQNETSRREAVW